MKFKLVFLSVVLAGCGKKPTANFTWSPQYPKTGQEVKFTNTSLGAKKYDWNLGNMKISSDANPKNVYTTSGDFIVDLTARNGLKSDTKTVTIAVAP